MPGPSSLIRGRATRSPSSAAAIAIRAAGRRVFGGVVEHVDQHLLDQDRVDMEQRQVGGDVDLDLAMLKRLARAA